MLTDAKSSLIVLMISHSQFKQILEITGRTDYQNIIINSPFEYFVKSFIIPKLLPKY